MASPLSPTPGISLNTWNFSTPPRYNTYDVDKYTTTTPRYEQGGSYEDHDSIDYDTDEASSSPRGSGDGSPYAGLPSCPWNP